MFIRWIPPYTPTPVEKLPVKELWINGVPVSISVEDYPKIQGHTWYISNSRGFLYVRTQGNKRGEKIYLHRFLLDAEKGQYVKFLNNNTLDCTRENIKLVTSQELAFTRRKTKNTRTSQYKGVFYNKQYSVRNNPWMAIIKLKGKTACIGFFKTEIEAALAYNTTAKDLFGPLAKLNPVED